MKIFILANNAIMASYDVTSDQEVEIYKKLIILPSSFPTFKIKLDNFYNGILCKINDDILYTFHRKVELISKSEVRAFWDENREIEKKFISFCTNPPLIYFDKINEDLEKA